MALAGFMSIFRPKVPQERVREMVQDLRSRKNETSKTGETTKLKALFAIKELATDRVMPEPMFEEKQLAKKHRKELNPKNDKGEEIFNFVVTLGPDHDKYESPTAKAKERRNHERKTASAAGSGKRRQRPLEEDPRGELDGSR